MSQLRTLAVALGGLLAVSTAGAQKVTETGPGAGGSPHVRAEWTIDGANITISYGRPSLKGRPESQLMPAGRPWRTGADTATIIRSDRPLTFGSVTLPAGSHTINTVPGNSWQLVLGQLSGPGQWGVPYQQNLEIGRVPMTASVSNTPVEQLTISIDDTAAGGTLRVEWGTTRVTVPFTVGR